MANKVPEDQLKEIKEAFFMFDPSGSGKMSISELGTAVRSLGQNPSESDIAKMNKEADPRGSGSLDEKTFTTIVSKYWKPVNSEEDIVDAFKVFDKEGSGYLEAKELTNVLLNLGEKLSQDEVDDLLKEANMDADGQLNYTSLTQMLLANANR